MSSQHQAKCAGCISGSGCAQRALAQRANQAAQAVKWVDLARQTAPAQPRRCIQCGAQAPAELQEGEGLPCGH